MVKNAHANAGAVGLISGSGRSPGGRNDNPVQYSCLGNPMENPLEKEMATQSTILAWEIPRSEETDRP